MIDELTDLLRRQRDAVRELEARLRAVELLVDAGEQRFLPMAVDEVEAAAERLAALELTRSLTLGALGAPVDLPARELAGAVGGEQALPFAALVDELRDGVAQVAMRRERVRHQLEAARDDGRARMDTLVTL